MKCTDPINPRLMYVVSISIENTEYYKIERLNLKEDMVEVNNVNNTKKSVD